HPALSVLVLPRPPLRAPRSPAASFSLAMSAPLPTPPSRPRLSTPSGNTSFTHPPTPNAPPISPSAAPATKASSFMTAINTGCPWTSPLCRRVAPRQNLPAGHAGPKAEATGYTRLIVQSLSPRRGLQSGGDFLLSPFLPNHSRGSLELTPSVIPTRLPPVVFPAARS